MKSSDITATDGRVIKAFSPIIHSVIDSTVNDKIKSEVDKSKIHIGVLTKYYPYLDKAQVKVGNKLIFCKILHRMHGSIIDFFTPDGDASFCEILNEPCIIPRSELDCLIADINDNTKEQLLLGYFIKEDIVFINPAKQGHYRISDVGSTNEYGLDVGTGNICINSNNGVTFTEGLIADENTVVEYATSDNVYDKKEIYTKEEVDEEIKKAIDKLREELTGDNSDSTG
ncbi:MAG: hypothetical protein IJQ68_10320 [Methanobrevibacter sp.]|uniref:hypothetical protein n=1 Tax=Methanobrevibacter sp. TaxID=66852 RepID=UPI0025E7F750|nr:hypothetical protein [Methanobrevibacter sp.]MBR0272361.1 hypothetical protein [Methanobrevibacter sp.]